MSSCFFNQLYGSAFMLLPVDKLAAITLQTLVSAAIASPNGVNFPPLAMDVGKRIEAEINVIKFTKGKKGLKIWEQEIVKNCSGSKPHQSWNKLRSLMNEDSWPDSTRVKVGSALLFLAVKNAMLEDGRPAFVHKNFYSPFLNKRVGLLEVDPDVIVKISTTSAIFGNPPYYPMLVNPKPWNNHKNDGGYFRLRPGIMRTKVKSQLSAVKKADIPEILEALNYLGDVPWRINSRVLDTIKKLWDSGVVVGEIPSKVDISLPSYEQVIEALNSKKMTFKKQDKVEEEPDSQIKSEKDVNANVVMNLPFEKEYTKMSKRVKMKNADLHSLRCDLQLKLSIAEKFREETFYFPSNLDFRGRAYPVPPNFSHLGSDLCRGLLLFDTAKPLGVEGLNWLKIHLSNLFGNNKITMQERIEWADMHLDDIRDSALRPFDGPRWWATAEEPFQALATCFEITDALNSGDPAKFMSRLPVHQDGSCNGLQHYAALGRDHPGATAVSLVPGEKPGDVYSAVLSIVLSKLDADAAYPDDPPGAVFDESESVENTKRKCRDFARLLKGHVNRKVIKQTVMTSVYGVTKLGARNQVRARLMEVFFPNSNELNDEDKETKVYWAAGYLADLTLQSLGEMFSSANQIMDWLGTCALLVAKVNQPISWVTPLGLPVIQPYRKSASYKVKTLLQTITLALDDDSLPVQIKKQKSAFPPNFVHSLDATHMLMTALRVKKSGISFAAVHDSYWTHAIDIPPMSSV
jgi:DNA-directed RNA polymerase, mitochondrial